MANKKQGFTLINAIFLMLIMILIGMGISTISTISLDSSVVSENIAADEQKIDGIANVIAETLEKEGENIPDDQWLTSAQKETITSSGLNLGQAAVWIFVDDENRKNRLGEDNEEHILNDFPDHVGDEHTTHSAFITLIAKENSNWEVGNVNPGYFVDKWEDSFPKLYTYNDVTSKSSITVSGGTGKYTCIVRIFKKE